MFNRDTFYKIIEDCSPKWQDAFRPSEPQLLTAAVAEGLNHLLAVIAPEFGWISQEEELIKPL